MQKTIISDASCIILLDTIGELPILQNLFGTIITTSEIALEFGKPLPAWFEIRQSTNKKLQTTLQEILDKGEASAIALAADYTDCLLIIDDLKGRKYAEHYGIKITGTLGVIVNAKLAGHISFIKPIIEKNNATNFRITEELISKALARAGE